MVKLKNLKYQGEDVEEVKGMNNVPFFEMPEKTAKALLIYEFEKGYKTVEAPKGWKVESKEGKTVITIKKKQTEAPKEGAE